MAELLVRIIDNTHDDFYVNCRVSKRGDVIHAADDGWAWGEGELTSPWYRIISVTAIDMSDAGSFMMPEQNLDPTNPNPTAQFRQYKINLDDASLPADFAAFLADDTRAAPIYYLTGKPTQNTPLGKLAAGLGKSLVSAPAAFTGDAFLALKVSKPPIADPAIIGGVANPATIG